MRINRWPGKFILVEGLDGSGKTTAMLRTIEMLSGSVDVTYLKGVGDKTFWGSVARRYAKTFLFVIELVSVTYGSLIPLLKSDQVVLMDKYYYFVASHIPDVNTWSSRLVLMLSKPFLVKPDLVIYFSVSLEERIRRLKTGKWSRFHQKLIDNPGWIRERDQKYLDVIRMTAAKLVVLDSTDLSPERVAQLLKEMIL